MAYSRFNPVALPFRRNEVTWVLHLSKINYVATVTPTCALCAISGVTFWTCSTFVSTGISWRREVSALNACVTRLTIHLAGINVTVTEPSRVSSLTCAAHVNKLAVGVDLIALFWRHALTAVIAGAHVNRGAPGCAGSFFVSSNKRQVELKTNKK